MEKMKLGEKVVGRGGEKMKRHSLGKRCVPRDGGGDGVGEKTFPGEKMRRLPREKMCPWGWRRSGVGEKTFPGEKMHPWGDEAREKTFLGRRWA